MADYIRGHPDHPKEVKDGILRHDGAGGLHFDKSMASVMALPGQPKPEDVVIALPDAELRAVSVGARQQSASFALGGFAPVDDDLFLDLGGVFGGGESGAITCVIERDGTRHIVFFSAEANASRARRRLGSRPGSDGDASPSPSREPRCGG